MISQNDTVLKLFRTVHLNDRNIALQSDIAKLSSIVKKIDANHYALKKETFKVADSICIETNTKNQIMNIIFSYNYAPEFSNDTAYIHEQRKYKKIISGNCKEFQYTGNGQSAKITKWASETTTFELVEVVTKEKVKVYSVIFDVALNVEKFKCITDLRKNSGSWEILGILGLK